MKTHWKSLTDPNYLGAWYLEDGRDITLTIRNVQLEKVTGTDGKKDDCVVCHFYENVKPMILNVTNMRMIAKLCGTDYVEDWVGRKIQIGAEKVAAFGGVVDALRVRDIVQDSGRCADCGQEISPVNGYTVMQLAAYTSKKYGRPLCSACATKAAEELKKQEEQQKQGGSQ